MRKLRQSIVLIGMMGAGKTAVGTELARRLSAKFVDSDAEIETAAALTVSEIFQRYGEGFFRDRETQVLDRLLSGRPGVLATGGGAWVQPRNRELIAQSGVSVWLDCDVETLWRRVRARPSRPLLQTPDPRGTLERLLDARRPVYAQADVAVAVAPDDALAATVEKVLTAIRTARPEVLEPA